ncbi:hypothetical protein SAMN04489712_105493 [Thermomonospora echinospora]|uniref:DUF932 domain-containing protein n=1 Tax=Thermomonospora echinospora TaxID=1992 RepID=A0A1H6AKX6_9ACTN|nr:DUF932 domain-containing protein [Thermomonospora echinospora]SEG48737.1 hypothetical protein SAMN04489712_105493 [Thermomonospora echinospora]
MTTFASAAESATRHAELKDLVALLRDQQGRKVDIVAPPSALRAEGGQLLISGTEPILTPTGVTCADGVYRSTATCEKGIAEKLKINLPYLRKCRDEAIELWDANGNGWLERAPASAKFLIRGFRGSGGEGVARALLSDAYKRVDHLDVLTAALEGVERAGVPITVQGCDLTEQRMYVRVYSSAVEVLAPRLLEGYRSPFTGAQGAANPVVWGGFVITNSETGCGAAAITPRIVVKVCDNGYTITADAHRAVHLGGKLDEGIIDWSGQTHQKNLELITAKTTDAVHRFFTPAYVQKIVTTMQAEAGVPIERPAETIQVVSQRLRFSEEQQDAILGHFIRGGDLTAGGVMHAVTSVARTLPDADTAHEMESRALQALQLATRG